MSADEQFSNHWQHLPGQQYSVPPPPPPLPQPGVVWMPPVANDRSLLRLVGSSTMFVALILGLPLVLAFTDISLPPVARLGYLILGLILPGLLLVYGTITLIHARHWDMINQRRQMAATWGAAAGVPLAAPQPFPNIEALQLPFTIKLKNARFLRVILFGLLTAVIFYIAFFLAFFYQDSFGLLGEASLLAVIERLLDHWFFFLLFPIGFFAACRACLVSPQSIEVTAQGLIIRDLMLDWFKTTSESSWQWVIPWQDARLFAIRTGKPGSATVTYELSSPVTVASFSRIIRPRWWALYQPAQSFGEYNAQMDALLALISARTGLPLYDVR